MTERVWVVQSGSMVEVVKAEDQWEAFDTLKERELEQFGMLVVATPEFGGDAEAIAVRTSMLFGKRWGRPDIAHRIIADAIEMGLPDTSEADIDVAKEE